MKIGQIPFQSADGISNELSLIVPEGSQTIVLCAPAMGVTAKRYRLLLNAFAEHGYAAAIFDLRGNGTSQLRAGRGTDFGYASLVEQELTAAVSCLKEHCPEHKLVLLGHSLGGQISSLLLSQKPEISNTLILAASCSVYYKNWPSPYRYFLLFFAQMAYLISLIIGYFPGYKLGFGGRESRGVMRDWAYNAWTGQYKLYNSQNSYTPFQVQESLQILAVNFSDDDFAPQPATDHLLSLIGSRNVVRKTLSGNDIELDRADHFNWLKSPNSLVKCVDNYLTDLADK